MKFDDARRYLIDNLENMNLVEVIGILSDIREEYAPTVEMTKEDINTLMFYLENSTFLSLIERKHAVIEAEMLGIVEGINEFLDLSEEKLMQAWLYPDSIKVIDVIPR